MRHAPFCGNGNKRARDYPQRGVSLIELVISLAILAVVVPALGALLVQIVRIPPRTQESIQLINEARQAQRQIQADGLRAQSFVLGSEPGYGTFGWYDYTASPVNRYEARYYYDTDRVRRELSVDGVVISDDTVARGVAAYSDLTIEACPTFVKGSILVASADTGSEANRTTDFYARLRTEPWGEPTSMPLGYALFAIGEAGSSVKGISLAGDKMTMTGNVHSNENAVLNGDNNSVTNAVTTVGAFTVSGSGNTFGSTSPGVTVRAAPINCAEDDFPSPTFSWVGNVNLGAQSQVWNGWPTREKLKPGVYYATGSLTLDDDNAVGTVTFIASQVIVNAKDTQLMPYAGGITAYATGTGADRIKLTLDDGIWRGMLYAPSGEVDLALSNGFTLYGSILAQGITLITDDNVDRVVHSAY